VRKEEENDMAFRNNECKKEPSFGCHEDLLGILDQLFDGGFIEEHEVPMVDIEIWAKPKAFYRTLIPVTDWAASSPKY
jgi:hypothetical protein